MEADLVRRPDLNTDRLVWVVGACLPLMQRPEYPHLRPAFPHGGERPPSEPQDKLWLENIPEELPEGHRPRAQAFHLDPVIFVGTVHQACTHFNRLFHQAARMGLGLVEDVPPEEVWAANEVRQEILARVPGADSKDGVVLPVVSPRHPAAQAYDAARRRYRADRQAIALAERLAREEFETDAVAQHTARVLLERSGSQASAKEILEALALVIPSESLGRLLHYVEEGPALPPHFEAESWTDYDPQEDL